MNAQKFNPVLRVFYAMIFIATMLFSMAIVSPVSAQTPAPTSCDKIGVTAWQNDNQTDGSTYGEAPVGGLNEKCGVVGQGWYVDQSGKSHRFTFYVRPNTVVWFAGHKGGTGWYFGGSDMEIRANLAQQSTELEERDGAMDTVMVILPDQMSELPIAVRYSSKAAPVTQTNTSITSQDQTNTGTTSQTGQITESLNKVKPVWTAFWKSDFGGMLKLLLQIAIVAAACFVAWSLGRGFWGKVLVFGVAIAVFLLLLTLGDLGWVILGVLVVLFLLWIRNQRFHSWIDGIVHPRPAAPAATPAATPAPAVAPATPVAAAAAADAAYLAATRATPADPVAIAAAHDAAVRARIAVGMSPVVPTR